MKLPFFSVAVIAMCLIMACSRNAEKQNTTADVTVDKLEDQATPSKEIAKPSTSNFTAPKIVTDEETVTTDTTTEPNNSSDATVLNAGGPTNEDWDKKIIKTARVTLELKDYAAFNTAVHDRLKRYGAYIAGEQQTESEMRIQNVLTIKVPVLQFEELMSNIGGNGVKVLEKSIATEDVTGEVVDTKARIEAKKGVRERYMELLKGAKTMKDILAVQEEINNIQEDLEAASGRVAYLQHNAAYSTINLTYYQFLNGNSSDTAEPTFINKVKESFATGGTIITNILLFSVSIWPLLLAGTVLLVYVKKGRLKKA